MDVPHKTNFIWMIYDGQNRSEQVIVIGLRNLGENELFFDLGMEIGFHDRSIGTLKVSRFICFDECGPGADKLEVSMSDDARPLLVFRSHIISGEGSSGRCSGTHHRGLSRSNGPASSLDVSRRSSNPRWVDWRHHNHTTQGAIYLLKSPSE